jgi:hypothetical protein
MRPAFLPTAPAALLAALAAAGPARPADPAVASIPVYEGDSVTVRVSGVSTARCEAVAVRGGLTRTLFSAVGRCGSPQMGLGQSVTIGPVPADGELTFYLSTVPSGGLARITGSEPEYEVEMDDGLYDADFNDVVLAVTVHGAPPELVCAPERVERGEEVACEVTGRATVRGWEFRGEYGPIPSSSTAREWRGTAVVGGQVTAVVTVGEEEQEVTDSYEVTARDWRWRAQEHFTFLEGRSPVLTRTEPRFRNDDTLGWNCYRYQCGGRRIQPDLRRGDAGYDAGRVESGPNEGLWYLRSVGFRMDRASGLNPQLLQDAPLRVLPEGPQARECRRRMGLQRGDTVRVNFYIFNTRCKGEDLAPVFAGILAHEGLGTRGDNGHESVGRAAALLEENDPYRALEDFVDEDEAELRRRVRETVLPMQDRIHAAAISHAEINGNYSRQQVWVWDDQTGQYHQRRWREPR